MVGKDTLPCALSTHTYTRTYIHICMCMYVCVYRKHTEFYLTTLLIEVKMLCYVVHRHANSVWEGYSTMCLVYTHTHKQT
jgi:hypothetical protein